MHRHRNLCTLLLLLLDPIGIFMQSQKPLTQTQTQHGMIYCYLVWSVYIAQRGIGNVHENELRGIGRYSFVICEI